MPTAVRPTSDIVMMEPSTAAAILESTGAPIVELERLVAVSAYAEEMRNGRWALNGDCISFDVNGRLLDGKLRLAACVKADCVFPTFVVENVSLEAAVTIDIHRKRRSADILHIAGKDHGVGLAAASNAALHLHKAVKLQRTTMIPPNRIREFVDANPEIAASVACVDAMVLRTSSPSILAAMHFLAWKVDPAKTDDFFKILDTAGDDPADTRPPAALARAIRAQKLSGISQGVLRFNLHILSVKAWNAFVDGAKVVRLRLTENGAIPKMKGLENVVIDTGIKPQPTAAAIRKSYQQAAHSTELSVEFKTITPAIAEKLLENNGPALEEAPRNRTQTKKAIDLYAKDMANGNWRLNGQAIKISTSGRLLDGQHRAAACVKSGASFDTMIISGLPDTVFSTYDLHAKKKFGVTVMKLGYPNSSVIAGALRIIWQREFFGLETSTFPTHVELYEALTRHGRSISNSTNYALRKSIQSLASATTMAAIHYILTDLDPRRAVEFFDGLDTGAELRVGSPILTVRNRLIEDKRSRRASASERDRLVFITRAWKAFVEGREMLALKKGVGFEPEFAEPHPIGVVQRMAA